MLGLLSMTTSLFCKARYLTNQLTFSILELSSLSLLLLWTSLSLESWNPNQKILTLLPSTTPVSLSFSSKECFTLSLRKFSNILSKFLRFSLRTLKKLKLASRKMNWDNSPNSRKDLNLRKLLTKSLCWPKVCSSWTMSWWESSRSTPKNFYLTASEESWEPHLTSCLIKDFSSSTNNLFHLSRSSSPWEPTSRDWRGL